MHGFKFGQLVFRCSQGMPFGIRDAPPYFQLLNRVATNALSKMSINDLFVFLYLDDRLVVQTYDDPKFSEHQTTMGTFLLALLLTCFGGFVSLNKSEWRPTTRIEFLGMLLDTVKCEIEVPRAKYEKTMTQIDEFLASEVKDIELLEKIRGRIVSWLVVCPTLRLYLREQNDTIAKAYKTNKFKWSKEDLEPYYIEEELQAW